jgi:hypothetical protein
MSGGLVLTPNKRIAGLPILRAGDTPEYFNFMVYGESGVGKTRLLGSADLVPALRKVLFLDIEGGTRSIRELYPNVETVRITSFYQIKEVYNEIATGNSGYSTVVLDSVNEMQKFNMNNVMLDVFKEHPERDIDVPSMREWGKNLEQMRRYIRAFRDLPINALFTCLAVSEKDEKTGRVNKRPGLSGKLSAEIAAFLDIVCYMYVKEVEGEDGKKEQRRMILTGATDQYVAKDRTAKLPMVMAEPTMVEIYELIKPTAKKETVNV